MFPVFVHEYAEQSWAYASWRNRQIGIDLAPVVIRTHVRGGKTRGEGLTSTRKNRDGHALRLGAT